MGSIFSIIAASALTVIFLLFVVHPVGRRLFLVMADSGDNGKLISLNYEVYGKVQGVFFRKHTNLRARELKLVGWVMNTSDDTVKGNLQGPKSEVGKMKKWLREIGSPRSRISKCVFTDEEQITQLEHKSFRIITRMLTTDIHLISVDYEVIGKVQGVCFRAYTKEMARKNRLVGWVKNTMSGSVIGCVQGPSAKVEILKHWLEYTGSPDSEITKCKFSNERVISKLEYCNFVVRY